MKKGIAILVLSSITILGVLFTIVLQSNTPGSTDQTIPVVEQTGLFTDQGSNNSMPPASDDDLHEHEPAPDNYEVIDLPTELPLPEVVSANPSPQFDEVLSGLYLDLYWVEECRSPSGSERALILVAQPSLNPEGGDIEYVKEAVNKWEPYMLQDVGQVLYHKQSYLEYQDTLLEFSDYDYEHRFANFMIGDESFELHYGWVLNFLVLTSTPECLAAVIYDTYAPHAH